MKKLLILYIIALVTISVNAQEVTVGAGTCGGSITSNLPVKYDDGSWTSGKSNSWSLMLYKKSELNNINGNLTQLGFYTDCGSTNYSTVNNQRIYIKETNISQITNGNIPDLSTYTKVFDGAITWQKKSSFTPNIITLTNPFTYSGTKNLLIYFENESGKGVSMWGSIPFIWNNQGAKRTASTPYKLSNKNSSIGAIDKVLPVTYFKFSTPSAPPVITMELDQNICRGSSFSFTTVDITPINPTLTLKWITSGTGTFNNNTIKNPSYTPSNTDITNGDVILTLTATNPDGSSDASFTLSISPLPSASIKKIN
ncbi:hypothetical protein PG913_06350 [Tenacibaculum pacificus]|uniref:hypothetical protein n=1 Tax=Tenacibaculum pacificus TaxID=3018314 RepID=UPI0022F3B81D|nr:hypothetical protein [Tenacibaculum pacificus]WBX72544.1 hypothetical protein PG913_06350 [Tenacibaculum pacificus]